MKVAVDNQISKDTIDYLKRNNIDVVFSAKDEHDDIWFESALDLGAEIFISPDFDIDRLCERYNVKYIELPQNLKTHKVNKFIMKKLNEYKNQ